VQHAAAHAHNHPAAYMSPAAGGQQSRRGHHHVNHLHNAPIASHSYPLSHAIKREGNQSSQQPLLQQQQQYSRGSPLFAPPSLQTHLQRMPSAHSAHQDAYVGAASAAHSHHGSMYRPPLHAQQQSLQQSAHHTQQQHQVHSGGLGGSMFQAPRTAQPQQDPFMMESLASAPMRQSSTNIFGIGGQSRAAVPVGESREVADESGLAVRIASHGLRYGVAKHGGKADSRVLSHFAGDSFPRTHRVTLLLRTARNKAHTVILTRRLRAGRVARL
jgi:hypothetical protein